MNTIKKYLQAPHAQSILEVIIAMAIFSLIGLVMASFVTGGFQGMRQGGEQTKAEALAQEGIEAVRAVRDRGWNELTSTPAIVSMSGNQWVISGGAEELIDNKYTRTITFSDVCRNESDEIVACPGLYIDIHSKRVTVNVIWEIREGVSNTVRRSAYVTNWDSREWTQTDWRGGPGQSIWSDTTRYDSDDSRIDYSTVVGQVALVDTSIGKWIFTGGVRVIDTTDTDFNSGSFNNTIVAGAGVGARVVLDQDTFWAEHDDSGSATTQDMWSLSVVSPADIWAVGKSGKILHYNGIDWSEFVDLGSQDLRAIDMLSSTDGWAVSHSGEIFHYNGATWSEFVDIGGNRWHDIEMVSTNDGWVGHGHSGEIFHYDGTAWSEFVDIGNAWHNVDMISSNDGWAVGKDGKIIHYNGTSWSEVSSPTNKELRGLDMVSTNDGWAVGKDGKILNYNGTSWSEVSSPTLKDLKSVSMVLTNDGWAVGQSGEIIHYDGSTWSLITSPVTSELRSVDMISSNDGWAVGKGGTILKYGSFYTDTGTFLSRIFDSSDTNTSWDQVYWTEVLSSGSDLTIATRTGNTAAPDVTWSSFSAELTDSDSSNLSSPEGRYFQYRATLTRGDSAGETPQLDDITVIYNAPTTKNLNDISIVSSLNVWAVGNSGKVLHYNGTTWSEFVDLGDVEIYAVDMVSSDDGWAVGEGGIIFQYNGTTWSSTSSPTNKDLNDVFMVDNDDGWAVGNNGTIIYFSGSSWSSISSPTTKHLNSLFMESEDDGWAVGESGVVLRADDGNWSEFIDTGDQVWHDIFMISSDDGWMVGDSGRIWHYNGTTWSEFVDTGSTNWRTIYFISSADGWAGGNNGELYHYDGSSWTSAPSPTTRRIKSIEMIDTADGWAVGDNGGILQLTTEGLYTENGWLVSSAFNMGDSSPVQVIEWDEIIPTCSPSCEIRFQLRTAPDSAGSPGVWTSWYGSSGSGTYFTNARGTLAPTDLNGNQWVQYRAELIGDGLHTPFLEEVSINYK